ncbi:MAG: chitobiase/beta-hexosaminidase C-terminal domain-containing protein [Cyclobacteriaceae bacterium]|nr:chitobiase/beta-hexosaminidase C-terminal domain-containing protein [Cyclobacteriaceae bacterium SS2]
MDRLEKIVSNSIFSLLCILTILLVFEEKVFVPVWLQPIGRMHPMILHFPIGFIVLLVLANIFRTQLPEEAFDKVNRFLLLLTSLTTVLTAIMGFFLSLEEGYTSEVLSIHKWIGVGVSYLMYFLVLFHRKRSLYQWSLYTSFIGIVIAGHFGAGLTHGINFLTEPILAKEEQDFDEQEPLLTSLILPILESKCSNCHNAEKHKGELDISTLEKLHAGGKNGPLWIAGNVDSSQFIVRADLPIDHKKHMPPKGKPQLTELELSLIRQWIKTGADESVSFAKLKKSDTLFLLAQRQLSSEKPVVGPQYTFDFADIDLVQSLNNPYRTVVQKAPNSPAIDVKILGRQTFKMEHLTGLKEIRNQVVSLDLAYLPVGDEVFEQIAQFPNLEDLNLNFTNISGSKLSVLNGLKKLKSLSLSGTNVTAEAMKELDNPELKELFIWNTNLKQTEIEQIVEKGVNAITGFEPDENEMLPLTTPLLAGGKKIITPQEPVELIHKIKGVTIRFTDDGSDPDSTSNIFTQFVNYDGDVTLKAYAYKDGWLNSDTVTFKLVQRGVKPKDVELLYPTTGIFKGKGKLTLIDDEVGNVRDLPYFSWLGFFNTPFGVIADLGDDPPALKVVAFNYGIEQRNMAAVPAVAELWGGDSKDELKLLQTKKLFYDKEEFRDRTSHRFSFDVDDVKFQYYKIIAHPVERLPEWHRHKGKKAGILIDQIFFYREPPKAGGTNNKKLIAQGT